MKISKCIFIISFVIFVLIFSLAAEPVPTRTGFTADKKPVLIRDNKALLCYGITYHFLRHEKTWENDLKLMQKLNINTIRIDLGWNDMEKENNKFNYAQLDRFISLAQKNNFLLVVSLAPNSHRQWLPEWFIKGPLAKETWQLMDNKGNTALGGWSNIPSPSHDTYLQYYQRYQKQVISHIKNNANIIGYVLYNEPHYPTDDKDLWYDYNPAAVRKFQQWLKSYYKNIKNLNRAWNENYKDFSNVRPITVIPDKWQELPLNDRKKLEDWRTFSSRVWCDFMASLIDNAKRTDSRHVVIVTEMPWWYWGEGSRAGVIPQIYDKADIIGIDIYPGPEEHEYDTPAAAVNMLISLYQYKKPVWLTEINEKNGDPSEGFVRQTISQAFTYGATGVFFFEWSDEDKKIDGGAYGLMDDDDSSNPEFEYYQKINAEIQKTDLLHEKLIEPAASVLWSENNLIQTYNDLTYAYSSRGVFTLLNKYQSSMDVITEEQFLKGDFNKNLPLIIPGLQFLKKETLSDIYQFVRNSGNVLMDAPFGKWLEDGLYQKPEGDKRSYAQLELNIKDISDSGSARLQVQDDFYFLKKKGKDIKISDQPVEILETKENAIARWDNKQPAISVKSVKKGKVMYIGTRIFDGAVWNLDKSRFNFYGKVTASFLLWCGSVSPGLLALPETDSTEAPVQEEEQVKEELYINHGRFVFLKLPYNQDFVALPPLDTSGTGWDLPGDEMPRYGSVFECLKHDAEFMMVNADNSRNTLECRGDKLYINSNKFIRLHILGCTHSNAREEDLILKYSQPEKLDVRPFYIEDWWGGCKQDDPDKHCGAFFSCHTEKEGKKWPEVHLSHVIIELDEYSTLEWIKLPNSNKFRILAITLEKKKYFINKTE